jgi:hypothetical protein
MVTRSLVLLALGAAACGRLEFATVDPSACQPGDEVCPFGCVGTDPDCTTSCGDGLCIGNAGELCRTCAADCATLEPVCGNGACDPGEPETGCIADCGPAPWPWLADEEELVALIDQIRTGGFMCATMPVTQLALELDPALEPAAREWAWELAHHRYFDAAGGACNGRIAADREAAGGFTGYVTAAGYTTARDALTAWLADPIQCEILMSPVPTQAFVAIAHDVTTGFVVVLR